MSQRIIEQSGVIPYRIHEGNLEVLLISSSDGQRWVVPKGLLEPDLTPADNAAKEALEEAGIRGEVLPGSVGRYSYDKWGGTCHVEVFVMRVEEVLDDWEEQNRTRVWLGVEEAAAQVSFQALGALIRLVPEVIHTR